MRKRWVLFIIYLAFIGLGLPDTLLGSGWPKMFKSLAVPVHYAGYIFMIIATGTVLSSLYGGRVIRRWGVGMTTTLSVGLTALALLGFAFAPNFIVLCLLAIPLGLGAGCVDVALNNYVALHYKASHMNWLHCCWGIGATLGPILMARYLAHGLSWTNGYRTVGSIQVVLAIILLLSIPLWVRKQESEETKPTSFSGTILKKIRTVPGLSSALVVFFSYGTIEATFGLWGASYLVWARDFKPGEAAQMVSLFYGGIIIGRLLSGFAALNLAKTTLIKIGQMCILFAGVLLLLPFQWLIGPGFFLIGLGCAPLFPTWLHETPVRFGKTDSDSIMGLQMASSYIGITLMPLCYGLLTSYIGFTSLVWFLLIFLVINLYFNRRMEKGIRAHDIPEQQ